MSIELGPLVVHQEVTTYQVKVFCPNDEVELETLPYRSMTAPPINHYRCPQCGYKLDTSQVFPRIEYR